MRFLLRYLYWWLIPVLAVTLVTVGLWLLARGVWPPVIVTEF